MKRASNFYDSSACYNKSRNSGITWLPKKASPKLFAARLYKWSGVTPSRAYPERWSREPRNAREKRARVLGLESQRSRGYVPPVDHNAALPPDHLGAHMVSVPFPGVERRISQILGALSYINRGEPDRRVPHSILQPSREGQTRARSALVVSSTTRRKVKGPLPAAGDRRATLLVFLARARGTSVCAQSDSFQFSRDIGLFERRRERASGRVRPHDFKMFTSLAQKLKFFYKPYALAIVSLGYVLGELGHYLIGVTSKATAIDLHYGDITCQLNSTTLAVIDLPVQCEKANSSEVCETLDINGTRYCEWNYNGLGLDYQILAGPSFIAVYTVMGVVLGFAADRVNRVRLLAVCTLVFSIAIILMGAVKEYWQLVILRMLAAAGEAACNPLSTGLLSDWFSEEKRGLVMSIFNWGIYGGYGIAFPVGRYVPRANAWDLGWRVCYYGAGIIGVIIAILTGFTLTEPERTTIGEETKSDGKKDPLWKVILQPRIILLCLAASIRHCGGMCFAYNCDLFYREYWPDYDLGWWLFAVTIVIGSIGVVVGGVISDKFVAKMGIRSRVAVLVVSQLVATPFAFGSVYFAPVGAMITLGISYFFAEMWFGIVFAILVEIVPLSMRSTTVGIFLFVMNNIGGNLPILVEPTSKAIGYRESLYIFYAGFYALSTLMFFATMFLMPGGTNDNKEANMDQEGHDNRNYIDDEGKTSTLELPRLPARTNLGYDNSHL